jgi:hypothetical protein
VGKVVVLGHEGRPRLRVLDQLGIEGERRPAPQLADLIQYLSQGLVVGSIRESVTHDVAPLLSMMD